VGIYGLVIADKADSEVRRFIDTSSDDLEWNIGQVEVDFLKLYIALIKIADSLDPGQFYSQVERGESETELSNALDVMVNRVDIFESTARRRINDSAFHEKVTIFKHDIEVFSRKIDVQIGRARVDRDWSEVFQQAKELKKAVRFFSLSALRDKIESESNIRKEYFEKIDFFKLNLYISMFVIFSLSGFSCFLLHVLMGRAESAERKSIEMIEASKELNNLSVKFSSAFEAASSGLMIVDIDGGLVNSNANIRNIFGFSNKEQPISGGDFVFSLTEDHKSEKVSLTELRRLIESGQQVELFIHRQDSSVIPALVGVSEMLINDTPQFIYSVTDLTVQRKTEEQLRRVQKMDAIVQLTGGIAHDFNNLLGIIIGNLELGKRKAQGIPPLASNLDKALTAAGRGTNITRRLLSFSRQTPSEVSIVDLNSIVRWFKDLTDQSVLGSTELQLRFDPDEPKIVCNQSDLEDALLNLALNARDAMPEGGRLIIETGQCQVGSGDKLVVAGLLPGRYGVLTISDTGMGMPPKIQERIFEPFFTTKSTGKGTGLGLPMVYGFVKQSKGHISVYSEEGLGTTFRLYLPISEEFDHTGTLESEGASSLAIPEGRETILIVDDEIGLRELAQVILSGLGYRTLLASNGEEAMAIVRSTPDIDLVFTDLVMPGSINGLQLAHSIMDEYPNTKILMASGFTGQIMDSETAAQWSESILAKPYSESGLANAIRAKLDKG
jgi:PAS domain S-box-containing protein